MKTETLAWNDFPWEPITQSETQNRRFLWPMIAMPMLIVFLVPGCAHAAGWETAKGSVRHILDYASYGVIVFSGGSWMFGHRNKALDLLLSCGIGTVIIRHADDIEAFFQSI